MPEDSKAASRSAQQEAWQRLWATGVSDSFGDASSTAHGLQGQPLADHWRAWLAALPAGSQVLDLCTGNGALPRWLIEVCPDPTVRCDGVDVVTVQPPWLDKLAPAQRERLRFHTGVSADDLPFEASSFDVVLSQYGIEYAGWPSALPEAVRVLRPGGQLACVMHHAASRSARLAQEEIRHARWLQQDGWLDAAAGMAEALSLLGSADGRQALATETRWASVRQRFDQAQQDLRERSDDSLCPDLLIDAQHWATQVFRLAADQGAQAGREGMDQVHRMVADAELRLLDLLDHALDEPQFQAATAMLTEAGLIVNEARPVHDGGHLMGWWLVATGGQP